MSGGERSALRLSRQFQFFEVFEISPQKGETAGKGEKVRYRLGELHAGKPEQRRKKEDKRQEEDPLTAGGDKCCLPCSAQHLKGHVADDDERLENERHTLRPAGDRADRDDFSVVRAEKRHDLRGKDVTDKP